MKRSTIITATSLALSTAVISGVTNFLSKISVTVVKDAIVFTTIKNVVVALLLVGIILGAKKWSEIKTLNRRHWLKLIAIGLIGGSVPFALYFTGLIHTSAINASLIHKSMFIWVLLLAIPLLKERMTKWQWVGIGAVAVANLFIGGFQEFKFNAGELMILAATMLWAIENIIAKLALKDISSLIVAGARMVFGSVALITFLAVRGGGSAVTHLSAAQWGWTLLPSLLLLGYVITWYAALKRAPATYVATLLVSATLVTNVLTAIFITHALPLIQIGGALFVTLGAYLMIKFAPPAAEITSNNIPPIQTHAEGGR